MSKFKLNKREKSWILYDVGNSAFTMLVSTLIPIYFNALASAEGVSSTDYLAYWGYAGSIATLLTAIIGPVFGTLADRKNYKKPIFTIALILGVASCAVLGFAWSWISFLVIFVFSKVCYSSSLVFYDAMLPETTSEERMDNVSSQGYAFGYIGSCIPFIACLVIVLMSDKLGLTQSAAMTIAFIITAAWWLVLTGPSYPPTGRRAHSRMRVRATDSRPRPAYSTFGFKQVRVIPRFLLLPPAPSTRRGRAPTPGAPRGIRPGPRVSGTRRRGSSVTAVWKVWGLGREPDSVTL